MNEPSVLVQVPSDRQGAVEINIEQGIVLELAYILSIRLCLIDNYRQSSLLGMCIGSPAQMGRCRAGHMILRSGRDWDCKPIGCRDCRQFDQPP